LIAISTEFAKRENVNVTIISKENFVKRPFARIIAIIKEFVTKENVIV